MARLGHLSLRLSKTERDRYQPLADRKGITLSEWIRRAADRAAKDEEKAIYEPQISTEGVTIRYPIDELGHITLGPNSYVEVGELVRAMKEAGHLVKVKTEAVIVTLQNPDNQEEDSRC